jgi:hypothetical protein
MGDVPQPDRAPANLVFMGLVGLCVEFWIVAAAVAAQYV